jgi:hypothetical protein
MFTRQQVIKKMEEYPELTQSAICVGAELSEGEFSHFLRGRRELSPDELRRVDVSIAACVNIIHDCYEFPVSWRSPRMPEIIKRYVRQQEDYRREMAATSES